MRGSYQPDSLDKWQKMRGPEVGDAELEDLKPWSIDPETVYLLSSLPPTNPLNRPTVQ